MKPCGCSQLCFMRTGTEIKDRQKKFEAAQTDNSHCYGDINMQM